MEIIKTIAIYLILALVCYLAGYLLKARKADLLKTISDLVQKAEATAQGSGMGAAKKAIVITQLEAAGIKVTASVDLAIDNIVTFLNEKSGWLIEKAKETK